jgi:TetR/AcrR family transcriptional regulator, transcriptional repressor of bet genes
VNQEDMMTNVNSRELRQEQVIAATTRCIVEKGLSNISVKDIAKEANVSAGIIYHYFENKESLLLQVIKKAFKKSHEQVIAAVENCPTPLVKLERHWENILKTPSENTEFFVVLLSYLGEVKQNPEIQSIVGKFFRNLRTYVDNYLQEGVEQGLFEPSKSKHISTLLYSLGLGLGVMWMMEPKTINIEECGKVFIEWIKKHIVKDGE